MQQANGDKEAASSTPNRLRSTALLKRQMCESPVQRTPPPKTLTKRVKIEDVFANPWRIESGAYKPLPIVHHKPVYNPPCYFDENMNHLTKSEKAMRIMSYHYALNMQLSVYAHSQPQQAAIGEPVPTSAVFNGNIEKKKPTGFTAGSVFLEQENTYISRSGRCVRRRQDPNSFHLSDDDEEEEQQKTAKKAKIIEVPNKTTPVAKRTTKKMTNDDIMARSSLFADSPVLTKSPRAQAMFSKMEETEKLTKKTELEKIKFEKTLEQADDEFEMEISSSHASPGTADPLATDDDFVRRRIEPPLPAKKRVIAAKKDQPSTSAVNNIDVDVKSIKPGGLATPPTIANKRGPKKKLTDCPICGKGFPVKEIQEHASTCGLTNEVEIESSIPNQRVDPPNY